MVEPSPAAYLSDLALSLNNLSLRLSEVGRREEGLAACEEAVTIYRRLTQTTPAAYLPDLATSLTNLSERLGELGRYDEARTAFEESIDLRRGGDS